MRVVLDTNVIVSSFIYATGNPGHIRDAWHTGTFEVVVTEPILEEYRRVLNYPRTRRRHHLSPAEIDLALDDIREMAVNVPDWPTLHVVADDPDDDKFLECAVAAQAEIIVSGDEHLLSLGSFQGIQVLTPAAFVVLLSQES